MKVNYMLWLSSIWKKGFIAQEREVEKSSFFSPGPPLPPNRDSHCSIIKIEASQGDFQVPLEKLKEIDNKELVWNKGKQAMQLIEQRSKEWSEGRGGKNAQVSFFPLLSFLSSFSLKVSFRFSSHRPYWLHSVWAFQIRASLSPPIVPPRFRSPADECTRRLEKKGKGKGKGKEGQKKNGEQEGERERERKEEKHKQKNKKRRISMSIERES